MGKWQGRALTAVATSTLALCRRYAPWAVPVGQLRLRGMPSDAWAMMLRMISLVPP